MSHIEKRSGKKGVTWRVQVTIGTARRSASFRRKVDAQQWATKVENALRDTQHFPDRQERQRTVADAIDRYRAAVLPHYSAYEQQQRGSRLAWWQERIGSIRLLQLKADNIAAALHHLENGGGPRAAVRGPASPGTQNRYLGTIRHVLTTAVREWDWLRESPAARVRDRREPRGRVRYLSDEERVRLLAACHSSSNPRLYPLVVLALRTGARLGELLRLGWSDIDLARGQAIVQESKNGERRTLPLAAECLEVLHALGRVRRLGSDVVLATAGGQATFPRKAWEAALRQSEVRDFRFHDLRHSFASYLAMSGATMPEIAAAMGHKTLAMVKRYAHLSDSHVSAVVARAAERFPV